jgi:hypothetical protein
MSSKVIPFLALAFLAAAGLSSASALEYQLSSELAKNHGPGAPHTSFIGVCQNDHDGDCLDDAMEDQLAQMVNPRIYFDEDEGCPTLYLYAQVRPVGHGVDVWRVDGRVKRVNITYFFLYTRDCKSVGGHLGDSEHVRYTLTSTNLKTWTLEKGRYWRHSGDSIISASHLNYIAQGVGSTRPVVAADEDGHGSWEAVSPYDDDCSDEDSILGIRDCFNRSSAIFSDFQVLPLLHNIGGPDLGRLNGPEKWRTGTSHLTVSGSQVYTERNGRREFWQGGNSKFCGWQCALANGDCLSPLSDCSGGLNGKLDQEVFSRQSRPVTAVDNNGQSFTYNCIFQRAGVWYQNNVTWTYRGDNPQGHLLYTATDIGGTHYYRLWYVGNIGLNAERWILESVAPNDWQGPAQVRCDNFDVLRSGDEIDFSGPSGACSNGVLQICGAPQ